MLKKYYIGLAVVLLLALYISSQYQTHAKDAKWDPPHWYRLFTWQEGVTTWALMLTLLAIAEQTNETAKAAKAAQESAKATQDSIPHQAKAAEAARLSADAADISAKAAMGIVVPTLIVDYFDLIRDNITLDTQAAWEIAFQTPKARISVKNYGQTPAFLKDWVIRFTCKELPRVPVYGNSTPLEKIVIESGKEHTFNTSHLLDNYYFSTADAKAIADKEKILRVYGRVRYGDIFGTKSHYLAFCETLISIREDGRLEWCGEEAPPEYRSN
jgi:hypothetical protein